jgi:DNA-binding GntR family transcriptional regulator
MARKKIPSPSAAAATDAAESMSDAAYRHLKRQIITNQLPHGSILDEKEIAETLGTSRTPVHEAVQRLEAEGFVEIFSRIGIRVRPLSLGDMKEIYDLLTALEVFAVIELTKRKPTLKELAPLTEAVRAMRAALDRENYVAWIDADEQFHRGLLTLSGNSRIAKVGLSYRDQVQRAHAIALRMRKPQGPAKSASAHSALIKLMSSGKIDEARDSHMAQRRRAAQELMDVVRKAGLTML